MNMVFQLVLLAVCMAIASAYPSGAPPPACANLAPKHNGTTPQNTPSPYEITFNQSTLASTGAMRVSITGGTVNGFILQARRKSDGAGVGMFDGTKLPAGTQLGPCTLLGKKISVTHTNPDDKNGLTFNWMTSSGENYDGDVYFQGAVAKDHNTFWVDIKSESFGIENKLTKPTTPKVTTKRTTPKVTTKQTTPKVTTKRTTPKVTTKRTTPKVTTKRTTPKVTTKRTTPKVTTKRTTPKVTTKRTTPKVTTKRTTPKVTTKRTTPKVTTKRTTPKVTIKRTTPKVTTKRTTPKVPKKPTTPKKVTTKPTTPKKVTTKPTTPKRPSTTHSGATQATFTFGLLLFSIAVLL